MTDHEADRRRARDLLNGDVAAFDAFFGEYFPRLYRFVLPRVGHNIQDAQDICQETLARALRRISSYRGEAALFSWVCQIARNQLADHWQQLQRERVHVVFAEDDPTVQAVIAGLQASDSDSPERERYYAELGRAVQTTLDNLPGRFGDALEWKYLDGLSVAEIAERLGVSTAAAQSLLQRARGAFREAFSAISEVTISELLAADGSPGSEA